MFYSSAAVAVDWQLQRKLVYAKSQNLPPVAVQLALLPPPYILLPACLSNVPRPGEKKKLSELNQIHASIDFHADLDLRLGDQCKIAQVFKLLTNFA